MPTTIDSAGITFNDATSLTSANGVPSALKLTTARTINGVSFDGTANITVPASGVSAAKAWVNFNGTLSTPITPSSSYNVSSITKNGTGDYTLNFPVGVFADANYSIVGTANSNYGNQSYILVTLAGTGSVTSGPVSLKTTTQVRILIGTGSGLLFDVQNISAIIFGN